MIINAVNQKEAKKLIKEQSKKDRAYYEDLILTLQLKIADLEQMIKLK